MSERQTINLDRIRLNGPWVAWWAVFSVLLLGVWYLRGAKAVGEQVVKEVRELRVDMREAREVIHSHDMRLTTLEEWKRSKSATGNKW